ncbi:RNA-binding protein involved in heterochromatin assembly dri1-like [Cornus florida]|uniref:RNA-binding protein involved in heterochromatin assembly dri1-like n=1 Tax=Cornus florida TaxID=4283 RepID=UPI00289DCEF7|nr:RNA-binding protein involved in heterochromatin assembly dri1-like [Cornus florida]
MSREGDWMCNSCQHMNFKKRDTCQRCQCPKFGGGTNVSYGVNRPEVLAGDWYCNAMNCGAHNYASRTSCYRCAAAKNDYCAYGGGMMASGAYAYGGSADIPGWKTGDWICNNLGCGLHNYASRMECYKCKKPRDF